MSKETESYPLALPVPENQYRTLLFFAGYGKTLAYLVGLLICAGGVALYWSGYGTAWLPAGIVVGAFVILLLNCFAELVHLIVDTMIPK